MKKILLFTFLSFTAYFRTYSQTSLGINFGLSSYEGDLHCFEEESLNIINSSGISFGVFLQKEFGRYFNGKLAYQYANFGGEDAKFANSSGHPYRNFSFDNNLHELTARIGLEPFKYRIVSPFISAGAGIAFNNPNTFFDISNKTAAEITQINVDQANLKKIIATLPISIGLNFRINEKIKLGTEFAWRLGTSDYLDGVSKSAFSDYNDYFGTGTITFNYNLSKPSKMKQLGYEPAKRNSDLSEQTEMKQPEPATSGEEPSKPAKSAIVKNTDNPTSTKTEEEIELELKARTEAIEAAKMKILAENEAKINMEVEARLKAQTDEKAKAEMALAEMDTDNDGIIDRLDACPKLYAKTISGCPANTVTIDINCEADFGERTINFATSFAELSGKDKATLDAVVSIMLACSSKILDINGYTDSAGSDLVNQQLSEKRANAVRGYITSKGVDSKRIKSFGYGESSPVASNSTESGRAKNRRVELLFRN